MSTHPRDDREAIIPLERLPSGRLNVIGPSRYTSAPPLRVPWLRLLAISTLGGLVGALIARLFGGPS